MELYASIRLNDTVWLRSNVAYIWNAQVYLKESKMKQNRISATESEELTVASLLHRDMVTYSFHETYYGS